MSGTPSASPKPGIAGRIAAAFIDSKLTPLIVIAAEHDAHPAIADRHRVWIEKIVADHLEHG